MGTQKNSGLHQILLRNMFYRDGYKKLTFILCAVLIINVTLLSVIVYRWTHPPQPHYFAMTASGRMLALHKLTDPVKTDDFIVQWAAQAVMRAFAVDFVHWREQLQDASNNFTPFGWRYFLKSLQASNNLTTVQKLKMVESAQVTGAPEIIRKGVVSGHYMWAVKLPILLTYTNINKTINQAMMVTLIVLRQPVQDMPSGVGINNFLANDS